MYQKTGVQMPKKSTFEIQRATMDWLDRIEDDGGQVDDEAEAQLNIILGDVEDKATALFYARQRTRAMQAEAKEMVEIGGIQKAKWHRQEMRIMGYLKNLLEAKEATGKKPRIEGAWGTAHLRKTQTLQIPDKEAVGLQWHKEKTTTSIDTVAIKKALKEGQEVKGCELVTVTASSILSKK